MKKSLGSLALIGLTCAAVAQANPAASVDKIRAQVAASLPRGRMNEIVQGQILIQLAVPVAEALESGQGAAGVSIPPDLAEYTFINRIAKTGWTLWKVPLIANTKTLAAQLKTRPGILFAQPVNRVYTLDIVPPNEPDYDLDETSDTFVLSFADEPVSFKRLWYLNDTNAKAGWEVYPNKWYTSTTHPKTGPLIAVVDTGCDMNHPDFMNAGGTSTDLRQGGQLEKRYGGFFQFGAKVAGGSQQDRNGHGTHVTGLVAAAGNNGSYAGNGVVGIGYNSRAMVVRVFDDAGQSTDADAAAGLYHAADQGADIINMSLGTTNFSQLFQDACTYAWQKGCLLVAAGNENGSGGGDLGPIYPAACSGVLAVSANGPYGTPATSTYSGYGPYVDIAAPGGDLVQSTDYFLLQYIFSTAVRGPSALSQNDAIYPPYTPDYTYLIGTSMACPQVAGAAGLFYGKNLLKQTSGYANVAAYRALEHASAGVMGAPHGGWEYYQGYGCLDVWSTLTGYDAREALVGAMEGIVYSNSTPLANVALFAQKTTGGITYSTTTRLDGAYRFESLPPGTYNVTTAPFGQVKSKKCIVRPGSDFSGFDFWCGTYFRGDSTPPTIAKLNVASTQESGITLDQWAYDTENGVDNISFKVGTTAGGSQVMAPTEIVTDKSSVALSFATSLTPGATYYVTGTYTNGAGLVSTKTTSFVRTVPAFDATCTLATVPATVNLTKGATLTIRMKNTGTTTWTSANASLRATDPMFKTQFTRDLSALPAGVSVAPGASYDFKPIIRPQRNGVWECKWQMKTGTTFFGGKSTNGLVTTNG